MKKLYAVIVALSFLTVSLAHATVEKTITVTNLDWNHFSDDACDCPFSGGNCTITVVVKSVNVVNNGSSWGVSGVLFSNHASISGGTQSLERDLITGSYTFPVNTVMIINATDFPGVPAIMVPLSGVTTASNGTFTVNVPK